MADLDHIINEVSANLSEQTISTTQANVDTLLIEVGYGMAKMQMIAWDQQ